ncbi:MAG TPA: ribonuclease E activity regulator RraA [Steroidobacteraceae bacterium]|jgi:regulator of ribonuclease activity A|nr:ribonuclease E activity regulator RraA [Steroidobacteraceae bacterium]
MKTADLVDAHDALVRFCDLSLRHFGRVRDFWGPIATVKCFEDNALLKTYLQEEGDGRVMVVDGGGSTRRALMGDKMALILRARGWAGIIVNGSIRDSLEIDRMEVGVVSLATTPKKSSKDGVGQRDVAVSFGGVEFCPGQYAYCDSDGVLVSAQRLA